MSVEYIVSRLGDRREPHDAGIIDQHIDSAMIGLGRVEHARHRSGVANIRLSDCCGTAGLVNLRRQRFRLVGPARIIDDDCEAVLGKPFRDGGADSAR